MEAGQKPISKEDFIALFKYQHTLLVQDEKSMVDWTTYSYNVSRLRSRLIRQLKKDNVNVQWRIILNDAIQPLCESSHRRYLYYKDPTCKICHKPILSLREATIDHIYPTSKGGSNSLENKQIAHGYCNVKKADKVSELYRNIVNGL